jgi:hypothetical protein
MAEVLSLRPAVLDNKDFPERFFRVFSHQVSPGCRAFPQEQYWLVQQFLQDMDHVLFGLNFVLGDNKTVTGRCDFRAKPVSPTIQVLTLRLLE